MVEIERKYLLRELPDEELLDMCDIKIINQYYISFDPEIRLRRVVSRKSGEKYYVTIKTRTDNELVRGEKEYEVDSELYFNLQSAAMTNTVEKIRYDILDNDNKYSMDIYTNIMHEDDRLAVVEVEFTSIEDVITFKEPEWFGKEITYNEHFKNVNLALNSLA